MRSKNSVLDFSRSVFLLAHALVCVSTRARSKRTQPIKLYLFYGITRVVFFLILLLILILMCLYLITDLYLKILHFCVRLRYMASSPQLKLAFINCIQLQRRVPYTLTGNLSEWIKIMIQKKKKSLNGSYIKYKTLIDTTNSLY